MTAADRRLQSRELGNSWFGRSSPVPVDRVTTSLGPAEIRSISQVTVSGRARSDHDSGAAHQPSDSAGSLHDRPVDDPPVGDRARSPQRSVCRLHRRLAHLARACRTYCQVVQSRLMTSAFISAVTGGDDRQCTWGGCRCRCGSPACVRPDVPRSTRHSPANATREASPTAPKLRLADVQAAGSVTFGPHSSIHRDRG